MHTSPDPQLVRAALEQVSASQGFNAWLKVGIVDLHTGGVTIEIELREELSQHHGAAHGGIVGALADTAASWAAATVAGDVRTASYTIHFLKAARGTRLRAVGTVLKAGRRQVSVEVKVHAGDGGDDWGAPVAVMLASVAPVAN
ncbi:MULTISPECIES: PaaI family thioesterase [unclassified Sphingomonas]|uniref:PaaI family thioesterase n=1 Tax=unclassified Sphingomonas TaxID=196159 RepID=UPI0008315A02|nr:MULTISPECIES: PaaI family thioesterase [unclassified Sphingomonas]